MNVDRVKNGNVVDREDMPKLPEAAAVGLDMCALFDMEPSKGELFVINRCKWLSEWIRIYQ